MPLARIVLGDVLGEGASGTVYAASDVGPALTGTAAAAAVGAVLAVKIFKPSSSDGRPVDEIAVALCAPRHDHILEALGYIDETVVGGASAPGGAAPGTRCLGLVLPRVQGAPMGSPPSFDSVTRDTFRADADFSLEAVLAVARGMAGALAHLHSHGVVHGDVYTHNVLLERANVAMLCDFGAAFVAPRDETLRDALQRIEVRGHTPTHTHARTPKHSHHMRARACMWVLLRQQVRALGCLLDDLLVRVHSGRAGETTYRALRTLADACMGEIDARPLFASVVTELAAF